MCFLVTLNVNTQYIVADTYINIAVKKGASIDDLNLIQWKENVPKNKFRSAKDFVFAIIFHCCFLKTI